MSLATDDSPEYPIWIPFLDILILVGFLIMVSSLLLYHSYLATENITTCKSTQDNKLKRKNQSQSPLKIDCIFLYLKGRMLNGKA